MKMMRQLEKSKLKKYYMNSNTIIYSIFFSYLIFSIQNVENLFYILIITSSLFHFPCFPCFFYLEMILYTNISSRINHQML